LPEYSSLILIAAAGGMQASFPVPMKLTTRWEWENIWLAFGCLGFVLLPGILAAVTVPHLGEVLSSSQSGSLLSAALFGLGWGCGSVCFGLGVKRLGIGLALSIILGLASALGSIIPWLTSAIKPLGYSVLLWGGVFVMLFGVVVCSRAGQKREEKLRSGKGEARGGRAFWTGLAICTASGILSCFMNLGLAYGTDLIRHAMALGASAAMAPNILWLVIMSGGFVANLVYCAYLLFTRKSWGKYRLETGRHLTWALVMALLWVGSLVAYGIGARKLGQLGPSVGWPILMSFNIVVSNLWGVSTGEWRGAGRQAAKTMVLGIGMLLVAVVIFGWASTKA